MNHSQSGDVARVLGTLLARYKVIVAVTLAVMGVAFAYTKLATPVYEAQAQVAYQAPAREDNPAGNAYPTTGLRADDMRTLVGYANSGSVRVAAAEAAGVELAELNQSATVIEEGNSSILNFDARSSSPEDAQRVADAYARALVADRTAIARTNIDAKIKSYRTALKTTKPTDAEMARRTQLQFELDKLTAQRGTLLKSLVVSNSAKLPEAPAWPRTFLTLFASLFVGLGLGSGVALLRATTDHKLRSSHIDMLPAPVLVQVPRSRQAPKLMPLGPNSADPLVADAFAALGSRVMLERSSPDRGHVVLVSSARAGEGKSTVAANLASALAQGGRRVILVDADLRRPTQDLVFPAMQGRPGLSQVLTGAAQLEQALTLVAPNLAAVASGPRQASASMLLSSVNMRSLLDRLAQISDIVVVDAPPVLPVTDSLSIAPAADQVLICARIGNSNLHEIEEASQRLAGAAATTPQAIVIIGTEAPTGYGYEREARGIVSADERAALPAPTGSPGPVGPPPGSGTGRAA